MNTVYRLVWNAAQNSWAVAGEFAATCGKGKNGLRRSVIASAVLATLGASMPASAYIPLPSAIDPGAQWNSSDPWVKEKDNDSLYNTAMGSGAEATGIDNSSAYGNKAHATATSATAIGANSTASANTSTAIGANSTASGVGSLAAGYNSIAQGLNSVALGNGAQSNDLDAVSIGYLANASGKESVAIRGIASGAESIAIGVVSKANNANDIALGSESVTGTTSTTTGVTLQGVDYQFAGASAGVKSQLSIGYSGHERLITNVGAGSLSGTSTDAVNGSQLYATNQALNSITASGTDYFHANSTGAAADAAGADSIALGESAKATYGNDVALGANSVTGATKGTSSVTLQGKSYNFAGTNPTSQVSVGSAGKERLVTNVAAGSLSATSTDAVNGSQLNATNTALNSLTTTVTSDALLWDASLGAFSAGHGSASTSKIVNVTAGTLSATSTDAVNGSQLYATNQKINAIDTRLTNVENTVINGGNGNTPAASNYVDVNTTAADAKASGTETVAIGGGSTATADNAVAIGSNSTADRANTVSVGSEGNERQIVNVAEGVDDSDAVNVAQLREATENLGDSMFQVNNSKKLANPTTTGANSIAGGAGSKATAENSMALGNGASATAKNAVALGTGSIADRENSVSVGSAGSERQITNVAAGTSDSDAANVGQVKEAYQYTDNKFASLKGMINDQEDKLSAGIAGAMAMAGLPQPYAPGASMMGLAGGTYNGESAVALGVSMISENGKWVSKLSGSTNTQGDMGAAIGVGYQFK